MKRALLTAGGLSKSFGTFRALDEAALSADAGEIVGLIGPNGAGKTTLLECVAGLLAPDAGLLLWKGEPIGGRRRKDLLFYMPDGIHPYPEQTAGSVLELFAVLHDSAGEHASLIERLALQGALDKRVGDLSKGTARRLLLALALLARQPLLILDEPFDGLDPHQTRAVMNLLRQERERGRSLVLSIHQLADAEKVCDRFYLLSAGRTIASGTLPELRERAGLREGGLEDAFFALT